MKKIKVFVDGVPLAKEHPSGIGHLLLSTLKALSNNMEFQKKYELVLFAPRNMYKKLYDTGIPRVQVKSLPVPAARVINVLNYAHVLPAVDTFMGKGIYLFGNFNNYPVSKLSKSITWLHDLSYERYPETVSPKLQHHLHKHVPSWIARTDKVVAISNFSRQEVLDFYGTDINKVSLVKAGIDPSFFTHISSDRIATVLQKYNLPKAYILFIGNIEPRKNLENLVKAFARMPQPIKSKYSLVIIGGDGWNNEAIHSAIDAAEKSGSKIIMPDTYVPDEALPAIISGAKFLVHPAIYEGFGMTPLEALACGTDVLVSDIPPLREVVGEHGDYFDLVAGIDGLAKALEIKFNAPTKITKETAKWLKDFSWQQSALQLLAVLEDLSATM